jgi:CDP-glycerol glycerophosphotransferase (TagB/SpsB family)
MMARGHWRRRAGWRTLVAAERDRGALIEEGDDPARIVTTGYVKAAFRQRTPAATWFADARPVIFYNPHWQAHRSSWWRWGRETVERIVADGRFNLIFAPHQRLVERAPELQAFAGKLAGRSDVHCDLDSFAMVDGSYTAAADLYLGDTSSQVVEYMMRPRPCVFLNALGADWQEEASYAMWGAGEVVETLDALIPAIERAPTLHPGHAAFQARFAQDALGDVSGRAPDRAAQEIIAALRR